MESTPIHVPMTVEADIEPIYLALECDTDNIELGIDTVIVVGEGEIYDGPYTAEPLEFDQTLRTKGKTMQKDVTFRAVPYSEVSNLGGGMTANIGG